MEEIGVQQYLIGLLMIIQKIVKQFILIVLTMRLPDGPQTKKKKDGKKI